MENLKLQTALVESYINGSGIIKKEQVESIVYYQWIGIIAGIYDIAKELGRLLLLADVKLENIEKTDEHKELFECIRVVFDMIGEVNGYKLFENNNFGKLLIAYATQDLSQEYNVDDFRLRFESYLARRIYTQNAMSEQMVKDLQFDKDLTRKLRSKSRKKYREVNLIPSMKNENSKNNVKYIPTDVLYIYKGNILCHKYNHKIIQTTGVFCDRFGKGIEINIEYCTECKKFILNYIAYQEYRKRYGAIVGNFRMVVNNSFKGGYVLADSSPLMLSGYNVGQQDDYSAKERQYLLSKIIYDNIMDKGEVIRYLSYFIQKNGAKRGNELALSKWREDLAFVQSYDLSTQPKMLIEDVKKY